MSSSRAVFYDESKSLSGLATQSMSSSSFEQAHSTTYGKLINEIRERHIKIYEIHDVYRPHPTAPEETPPAGFVTMDTKQIGSGIDFKVFPGSLVSNYNGMPQIFKITRAPNSEYGDHEFRAGGASGGGGSFATFGSEPKRIPVALKECVKSIHKSGGRETVLATFLREIRILGQLQSASVVTLFGTAFSSVPDSDEVKPTLILELASYHLAEFFTKSRELSISIDWTTRTRFALDICNALDFVHRNGFTHADVKGQNVLIFQENDSHRAKLSDFGHSRETESTILEIGGTPRFWAPECWPKSPLFNLTHVNGVARDIYALGLVMWEMATDFLHQPFYGCTDDSDVENVLLERGEDTTTLDHQNPNLPDETPAYFRAIASNTLKAHPEKRPKLHDIITSLQQLLRTETQEGMMAAISLNHDLDSDETPTVSTLEDPMVINSTEDPLPKVPLSLQEHLLREFRESNNASPSSFAYLAYCYILVSDTAPRQERERALPFLREAAKDDPLLNIQGSQLTPFRMLMELHDWEGLLSVFQRNANASPDIPPSLLSHVYSFGWQKLIMYACMAKDGEAGIKTIDKDPLPSEDVACKVLELFLKSHTCPANVGAASYNNVTALHAASLTGKVNAVSKLLENGADVDAKEPSDSRTALHLCCQSKNLSDELSTELARLILAVHPSAVNTEIPWKKYTPLRLALEARKRSLFVFLVERGADANASAENSSTIMNQCAWMDDVGLHCARILLNTGNVEVNAKNRLGTALGVATNPTHFRETRYDMVKLLLEHGADVKIPFNDTPLVCLAIENERRFKDGNALLMLLLQYGAPCKEVYKSQNLKLTAIHYAAATHTLSSLGVLLDHDPTLYAYAHSALQSKPLHLTVRNQRTCSEEDYCAIVDFLIECVAETPLCSVDDPDEDGNTVLHYACLYGDECIIPQLLAAGSSILVATKKGEYPLNLYMKWLCEAEKQPSEKLSIIQSLYHGNHGSSIPVDVIDAIQASLQGERESNQLLSVDNMNKEVPAKQPPEGQNDRSSGAVHPLGHHAVASDGAGGEGSDRPIR